MALRTQISERQRRFGTELRRLRLSADIAVQDAATHIGIRGPQLNHIEAARTGLDEARMRTLARFYGCTDDPYMDALATMGASSGKGWWSSYKGRIPGFALDLAELESSGIARYLNYETFFVPGLLQTEEYVRRLFENGDTSLSPAQIEDTVRFRLDRQRILTSSARTRFTFVLHEAALLMNFAGAAAMRRQLTHLLKVSELPNVDVQIYPFNVRATPPFSGPFLIAEPGPVELSTVVIDHPGASGFTDSPEAVQRYRSRFADLSRLALPSGDAKSYAEPNSPRDSWAVIQHAKHSLEMGGQS
ncbi:helix-turn-helix domain-containing protein [Kitasatospora viridis]|uniref:Helix-turn-helix protein n=1 Tax=Kitasatospora viridis TaxID=281105 RepID=A0A561UI08_9ACTN|nr:helix-turn-helix transcriptional regulator [Kitasatospora viridis]TWF98995.1 helix-turn-helix protein [Kitasatospora viridis]